MLSDDLMRYVALYRRLGRSFDEQSRTLHLYARHAEAHGDQHTLVSRFRDCVQRLRRRYARANMIPTCTDQNS